MTVLHKVKFMQKFTFAINVESLNSTLLAKLLMQNCACAKYAKHVNEACKSFYRFIRVENSVPAKHIQQQYIDLFYIPDFLKPMKRPKNKNLKFLFA